MTRFYQILTAFRSLYWTDKILAVLILTIAILLACAALFALLVILLRMRNKRVRSQWIRLESQWEERLLDVLAGEQNISVLTSHVEPEDEGRFVDFLLRFAVQLRGGERDSLRVIAAPYLPATAAQMSSHNPERRARAVLVMSGLGSREDQASIVRALNDESELVVMVAARALANDDQVDHTGRILEHIDRFENWNPRHLAAMFAAVGPRAAPSLRATLADAGAGERARIVAAESLLLLRDFESASAARTIAHGWATPSVLVAALRLLAAVGTGADADVARRCVLATHAAVRGAAVLAVGALGDASDVPLIERTLADPSPWVALNAASALRDVGAIDRLEQIAHSDAPGAHAARELLVKASA